MGAGASAGLAGALKKATASELQALVRELSQSSLDKLSAALDSLGPAPLPPVLHAARQILISQGVSGVTEEIEIPDNCQTIFDFKCLIANKHSVPRRFIVITCADSVEDDQAPLKFDDSAEYAYVMKTNWDEIFDLEGLNGCGIKLCRHWLRDRHQSSLWNNLHKQIQEEHRTRDENWLERGFLEISFLGGPELTMATLMETRDGILETDFFMYKSGESELWKSPFAQAMTFGWIDVGEYLVANYRNYVLINEVIGMDDDESDHEELDRGDSWGFSALCNPYDGLTPLMAAIVMCAGGGFDQDELKSIGRRFLTLILSYDNLDVNYKIKSGQHSGTTALGMAKELKLRDVWDTLRSRGAGQPLSKSSACAIMTITCADLNDIERLHRYFMADNHMRPELFTFEVFDAKGKQIHVTGVADLTTMLAHCPLKIKFSKRETGETIEDYSVDLIFNRKEDLTEEVITKRCAEKGISCPDSNYELQVFDSCDRRVDGTSLTERCFPVTFKFVKFHYSFAITLAQVREMKGFKFVQDPRNHIHERFVTRIVKDFLQGKDLKMDQVSKRYFNKRMDALDNRWCFSAEDFPMTVGLFKLDGVEKEPEEDVVNHTVWDVSDQD